MGILREKVGKYTFGDSWAQRFFERHDMVLKVFTSKMREHPAEFEDKKNNYIKVGRDYIFKYRTPAESVISCGETNVQFVDHASRTRDMKGVKRCEILGKGSDKVQITVTIFVTESGEVLPYQIIFEGKTTKCHPVNQIKPNDCLWTHTQSHWQTVPTYMDVIENIIVPYKNYLISHMGLPSNQHTILEHDLHYTHKDSRVLELMKSHNILPLFVPAGCTDLMQCSVILYIHAPVHIYGVTYYSTTTTSDVVGAYNTSGPWNLMLSGHANY